MKRKSDSKDAHRKHRVARIMAILREAEVVPRTWSRGTDAWKKRVALKHGVSKGVLYRWKNRFDENGIVGLEHHKSNVGPRVWMPAEALDFWIGFCLLPQKREMSLKVLYEDLITEARIRGWHVGSWESAKWWLTKKSKMLMGI